MRIFLFSFLIAVLGGMVFFGCGGPPQVSWENIDRYNFDVVEAEPNLRIPANHLYELIYFSRVAALGGPVTDSMITQFRDSLVVDTLISLTSDQFNLDNYWYQYQDFRDRADGALRTAFWDNQVTPKAEVDSQEVSEYYQNNLEQFSLPEQIDVYHILSSPLGFLQGRDSALYAGSTRDDLTAFAEVFARRLHRLLVFGESFENVAFNYSHDLRSRNQSGHMGWTKRGTYVDPFDSVAFSLKDAEFSEPYQDGDGWHILYRARSLPGGPQPLDTPWVYSRVQQAAFEEKAAKSAAQILDSLREVTNVRINDLLLSDTIVYLVDDSVWAAVVDETDTVYFYTLKGLEDGYRRRFGVSNTTPDQRRIMVTHAAGPVTVALAARSLGLDTLRPQVEARRKSWNEVTKALRLALLYSVDEFIPTDSEINQYYQDHYTIYNPEEHIKAEQLIVQNKELAHFLVEQINSGFDLDYLADYYGKQEGYDVKFEDMGIIKRSKIDATLYDALEKTHALFMTDIIKTSRGYHIARVLDREYRRPLEMVRGEITGEIRKEFQRRKWQTFRDQIFQAQQVKFPGILPPFELPRLAERNHLRTLPPPVNVRGY